jgi:acetyl-CoA C-acetyltransferase
MEMSEGVRDVVIAAPLRTAVGGFGGAYRGVSAADLGAQMVQQLMKTTGVDFAAVDEVVFGHCYPTSEAPDIGRVVALDAGLPVEVTGVQVDRRCGSGLQAVIYAAFEVAHGDSDLVIAGGVESMSNIPYYTLDMRWGARSGQVEMHDPLVRGRATPGGRNYPVEGGMLETAENLRRDYDISRDEQDQLAWESHQRAVRAVDNGLFADEIVPITVPGPKGTSTVVDVDEHPRRGLGLERLGSLPALRKAVDPEATVTAGNACGQNDGAAACFVTTPQHAERLGLQPLAYLRSWARSGVDPSRMGIGPVQAVEGAVERAGVSLADVDLLEVNEAFAAQVLACTRAWGFGADDFQRLNVNGSGISLGHPVGATGGRILATLLHEMQRREVRWGVESMCIGGGQGMAAVFERFEA